MKKSQFVKENAGALISDYLNNHGVKKGWVANQLGINRSYFSQQLNGTNHAKINAELAMRIADLLGLPRDYFLN